MKLTDIINKEFRINQKKDSLFSRIMKPIAYTLLAAAFYLSNGCSNETSSAPQPQSPLPYGKIVFQSNRDGNWEIYRKGSGSNYQEINLTNDWADDTDPTWSPDGTEIAFASNRTGDWEIWTMNEDGSGLVNITNSPSTKDTYPTWSPSGISIAYAKDDVSICVINSSGGIPTNISPSGWSTIDFEAVKEPDWGANNKILFTGVPVLPYATTMAYFMNSDGSNVVRTYSLGKQPAWHSLTALKTIADGWISNTDGTQNLQVLGNISYNNRCSPDGTQLLFDDYAALRIANISGSIDDCVVTIVSSSSRNTNPDWAP